MSEWFDECEYCTAPTSYQAWRDEYDAYIYICTDCRADEAYVARRTEGVSWGAQKLVRSY